MCDYNSPVILSVPPVCPLLITPPVVSTLPNVVLPRLAGMGVVLVAFFAAYVVVLKGSSAKVYNAVPVTE